ncbi:ADAMTS-like protein 1 [Asterias rubens]|uniref:ADAMTS-like protein 1 n=1 Tax=Asterias rubens TaxID=7604 RepID=UPI0014551380|nr:ADAMTS-like protein 1 [Asterias rubens]
MGLRKFEFGIRVVVWFGSLVMVACTVSPIWTEWEEWTNCSRKCDWGVTLQKRRCLQGNCQGPEKRYRTCKITECPPGTPDFRAQQCALSNDEKHTDGQMYDWIPVEDLPPDQRCTLTCRARGEDVTKVLSPKVLDGTMCSSDSIDMCILGKCEPVGCDHQLNSTGTLDRCSVCNGDNTTCKLMKGNRLTLPPTPGASLVQEILTIPEGSRSIRLTSKGPNFLGFRGTITWSSLQWNPPPTDFGEYQLGDSLVRYTTLQSGRERVYIDGPLTEPVKVFVIFPETSTVKEKVHYQYVVPLEFGWRGVGWGDCSATCGQGEQEKVYVCINLSTSQVEPDSSCEQNKPEYERRKCTMATCPPLWQADPWQPCSRTCSGGIQTRNIYCVERAPNNMMMRVDDDMCYGSKPHPQQRCNLEPCPHWLTGNWSECSVTCGHGTKQREVNCLNSRREPSGGCDHRARPTLTKTCIVGVPCVREQVTSAPMMRITEQIAHQPFQRFTKPSYHASDWSPCTVTCGSGKRFRSVRCKVYLPSNQMLQDLTDLECLDLPKPDEISDCEEDECDSYDPEENTVPSDGFAEGVEGGPLEVQFVWRYTGFTECSASCVGGVKESLIQCVHIADEGPVSDTLCDITTRPDIFTQVCNEQPCPPEWKIPLYKECSVSCGGGVQYPLEVLCMRTMDRGLGNTAVLPDSACEGIPIPNDPLPCNQINCPGFWHTGYWSECSQTCLGGIRSRPLTCKIRSMNGEITIVDWVHCPTEEPSSIETCNSGPCQEVYEWKPQDWSECSVTCGVGIKVRTITCLRHQPDGSSPLVDFRLCPQSSQPSHTEFCQQKPCTDPVILANHTTYSQVGFKSKLRLTVGMSVNINKGVSITVKCPVRYYKKSELEWYRGTKEIAASDPRAKVLPDGTLRVRHVKEQDEGVYTCVAGKTRERFILHIIANEERKGPSLYGVRWLIGNWSTCSVTCGGGIQTRSVDCLRTSIVGRTRPNPDRQCSDQGLGLPDRQTACNIHSCQPHWVPGPWQECNEQCSDAFGGTQARDIACEGSRQETLPDSECDASTKPEIRQPCPSGQCTPIWTATDWSMCSVSCGNEGIQTRTIQCQYSGTRDLALSTACINLNQPAVTRRCINQPQCPQGVCEDELNFCSLVKRMKKCQLHAYQTSCCKTCS